ncbi:MAG: ABC transporter substrate-binding protein [Firmicutes bacterium]|nr:ABC transporter substrate-binding protein [Bacillota bacterium]
MKKTLLILCFLVLCLGLCTACGQPAEEPIASDPVVSENDTEAAGEDQREIVDMAGRSVSLPLDISTGLGTGAIGSYMLYTLDPQMMVGVNYEFNDAEKDFILSEYHDLPAFGQGDGLNLEAVIAAGPDILISYETISESAISTANDLQQQTGIPCILLDGALQAVPEAYRLLGEIFDMEERAEELATYAEEALAFAEGIEVPEEEQVSVYFGNGLEHLETAPLGSWHAELLQLVDAANVAEAAGDMAIRIDISAEQLISWNPQIILLNGEPSENISPRQAVEDFLKDSRYQNIQAVQAGQVYAIPKYPYSWFDRPPGPNRLIGIYWLAELLYPEKFDLDIADEARKFYSLYYHMELSVEQLAELLGYEI